ncbi:sodium:proton antiporter [Cyanobacterium stanieri LEGE 03274]|uniref:Sodium:proton antiporter n=1 Tax=Cyanobacterium stanieri LEGE 03274 TaxID=1828756 RepID=A0ABR9V5W9_9CHRO|nr:sodium:proton antiporter [Cyanobacterium stanieri]MBE9223280.1 sodium:proton antiporter [Cyanobacterium stanieri LEGE 03274]
MFKAFLFAETITEFDIDSLANNNSDVAGLVDALIILLLIATVVALVSRKLKIPYVVGLVLAGLIVTQGALPDFIGLNPDVILNLFLPILIFEAAINTDISRLKSTIKPIALLALPGVLIGSTITATFYQFSMGLPWITVAAMAVILTITDTVSVIVAFRTVSVPSRLATIVEGESLFNDAVALVLLNVLAGIHLQGSFSLGDGIIQILIAFLGGGLLGLGLGYLCVGLFQQLDDALSSILLTVAVSLLTFQIGQLLQVSSAIAVVIAGLVIGNSGFKKISATTELTLLNFWEYAGFGVNTFIFLLVGIVIEPKTLIATFPLALLAIIGYQIGRVLSIYPLLYLLKKLDRPIPLKWQHVLILGNVKGSLSMALAIGLPLTLPERTQVIAIVFSTVLISLVGQGLSLPWLVKKLQLSQPSPLKQEIEHLQLTLIASKAAQKELDILFQSGSLSRSLYEEIFASYQAKIAQGEKKLRDIYNQRSTTITEDKYINSLKRRLYLAEQGAVRDGVRKGILGEDLAQDYLSTLNEQLLSLKDDD